MNDKGTTKCEIITAFGDKKLPHPIFNTHHAPRPDKLSYIYKLTFVWILIAESDFFEKGRYEVIVPAAVKPTSKTTA